MAYKSQQIQSPPPKWPSRPDGRDPGRRFWNTQFLPIWLPLLLGSVMAIGLASMIVDQAWIVIMPALMVIPAVVLLLSFPFSAIFLYFLLVPFFIQEFGFGSRYIYWILHRALVPMAIGLVILLEIAGIRRIRPIKWMGIDWFILAFLIYSIANISFTSPDLTGSLIRYYDRFIIPFGLYFLMRLLGPKEEELKWLVPAAILTIWFQSAIGVTSWYAPQLLPTVWLSRIGERTVGSLANPAVLSTTLIFCALILIQFVQQTKSGFQKLIILLSIGLAFFIVFMTFSRGSWLGGAMVWLGLIFLFPRILGKLTIAGFVAAVVVLTIFLSSFSAYAGERLTATAPVEGRIIGGAATVRMIVQKPVFGWGYDNHERFDEQFRTGVLGLADPAAHTSHHTYLLMTSERGLVGLFVYVLPAVWLLGATFTNWKQFKPGGLLGREMLVMLWLLLVDHFIVGNFTDLIRSNFYSTSMWWLVLGWIANIVQNAKVSEPRFEQPIASQMHVR